MLRARRRRGSVLSAGEQLVALASRMQFRRYMRGAKFADSAA